MNLFLYLSQPLLGILAVLIALLFLANKRDAPGAKSLLLLTTISGVFFMAVIGEILSLTVAAKVFWLKVEYLTLALAPLILLSFAVSYTGQTSFIRQPHAALIAAIPLATVFFTFTNSRLHLMWESVTLHPSGYLLRLDYGPWFWIHTIYSFGLVTSAAFLLVRALPYLPRPQRFPIIVVIIGILSTVVFSILYVSGTLPEWMLNPSLLTGAFTVLALAWSFGRRELLHTIPVDRGLLLDALDDGLLVLNPEGYITDVNHVAARILGRTPRELRGHHIEQTLQHDPDLLAWLYTTFQDLERHITERTYQGHVYEVKSTPILLQHARLAGWAILFHDVTERKLAEDRAATLRDITLALTAHTDVNALLDEILRQAQRLVPHDTANIALVEGKVTRIVRWRGYDEHGASEAVANLVQSIDQFTIDAEVIRTGKPRIIYDTREEPEWVIVEATRWIRSHLVIPICHQGKVLGLLRLDSAHPHHFTEEHVERLRPLASTAAIALEKARLYERARQELTRRRQAEIILQHRLRQLEVLYHLSERLAPAQDVHAVCRTVVEGLHTIIGYTYLGIFLVDEETGDRVLCASRGWEMDVSPGRLRPGEGLSERALLDGRLHYTPDVRKEPRYVPGVGTGAEVDIPLRIGDEIVGVLVVESAQPHSFTEDDFATLTAVAHQTGLALERARLLERVQRQQHAISRLITHQATTEGRLEEILPRIAEMTCETLRVHRTTIWLFDERRDSFTCVEGYDRSSETHFAGDVFQPEEYPRYSQAIAQEHVIAASDVCQDARLAEFATTYWKPLDIRSAIQISIRPRGRIAGILSIEHKHTYRTWHADEIRFATEIGDLLAQLLLNEELRKRAAQMQALNETLLDLTSMHDIRQLLNTIVERATALLGGTGGGMYLTDPEKRTVRCVVSYRTRRDFTGVVLAYGEGAAGLVAETGQPLIVDDYHAWSGRAREFEEERPFCSVLSAPMIWQDEVVGVIHVLHDQPHHFSQDDLDLLMLFARQAAIALHNARLLEQERRRRQEVEALRRASLRITSSLDLSTVLEAILESTLELLPADDAHIFLYDGEKLSFGAAYWDGKVQKEPFAHPRPHGVTYTVARTGEPMIIPDANAHPLYQDWQWGGALASLPLRVGGRVVGVMNLAFTRPRPFREEDVQLLRLFADQAAIAIENARLLRETQSRARELSTLLHVSQALSASVSLQDVLGVVAREVTNALNTTACAILRWDREHDVVTALYSYTTKNNISPCPVGTTYSLDKYPLTRSVLESGNPALVLTEDTEDTPAEQEHMMKQGVQTILMLPLKSGDRVFGLIRVADEDERSFTEEELRLALALAEQAAIAFERAELFAATRRQAVELQTLRDVLQELNASPHIEESFNAIARILNKLTHADRTSLVLIDETTQTFSVIGLGEEEATLGKGTRLPLSTSAAAADVLAGRVHITPDLLEEMEASSEQALVEAGYRSRINVPLRVGNRVLGALNFTWRTPSGFSPEHIPLLQQIADAVAIALERSRLLEATRRQAQELASLYDAALSLTSTLNTADILPYLYEKVSDLSDPDSFGVFRYHPESNEVEVLLAIEKGETLDQLIGARLPLEDAGLTGWVMRQRQSLLITDLERDDLPVRPRQVTPVPIRSWLGVPLLVGDRLVGAMSVQSFRAHAFDESTKRFLESLAPQVALSLENARLYEAERATRERAERLFEAAQALSATLDLQEVFERILKELQKVVPYDSASVQELRGDELVIIGGHGFPNLEDLVGLAFNIHAKDNPNGEVIRTRKPLILEDAPSKYPRFRAEPHRQARVRAWLGVPMLYGARVVGMIALDKREPGFYTEEHARIATAFAAQAAIAIENARLYHTALEAAERRTILHQVSQDIVRAGYEPEKVFQAIHRAVVQLMPAEAFLIALYEEESHEIYGAYLVDRNGPQPPKRIPDHMGLSGYVISTGKPVIIDDMHELDTAFIPVHFGDDEHVRSVLMVPMRLGNRTIGVISAQSYRPRAYTEDDLHLLEMLAAFTAGVLENVRLFAERQQLLTRIQEQAERMQRVLDSMPEGILLLGADRHIIMANPQAHDYLPVLGVENPQGPVTHLGDRPIEEVLQPVTPGFLPEVYALDGSNRIFEVAAEPLGGHDGEAGWVILIRDVTREREVQQRIQQQERLAAIGQLAAGIAHDFNNILQGIIGFANLLARRDDLPDEVRRRLKLIVEQGERGARLVRQVLDFSRSTVPHRRPLELDDIVREVVYWLRETFPEHVQIVHEIGEGPFTVNADPTQMQQVLTNLAMNARDAMPEGGVLRIQLEAITFTPGDPLPLPDMSPGPWVVLRVSDTGTGIPPDILPHIFEPFFTTKDVDKGVGLGLAQVYGIIQQHEGIIDVETQVGRGTTFIVYLPMLSLQPPGEARRPDVAQTQA